MTAILTLRGHGNSIYEVRSDRPLVPAKGFNCSRRVQGTYSIPYLRFRQTALMISELFVYISFIRFHSNTDKNGVLCPCTVKSRAFYLISPTCNSYLWLQAHNHRLQQNNLDCLQANSQLSIVYPIDVTEITTASSGSILILEKEV